MGHSRLFKILFACVLNLIVFTLSVVGAEENLPYQKGPAIWEVSDDDTTVYLFGTVHILYEDTQWRTDYINSIWNSAETAYFETDVSPEAVAELQNIVLSKALNERGVTLSSYFNEEELLLLKEAVAEVGLPFSAVEPYRPWFVSTTLTAMQIVAEGGNLDFGVDMILWREAQEKNRQIRYFESGEEQINLLANLPDEVAAQMLIEGIRYSKEYPDFFSKLVDLWKEGNAEELGKMISGSLGTTDLALAETILYERNENWANALTTVLEQETGTFFIAVGAGHLVGEKSVQEYLRENGYTARRH